jgi:hypothetical protein
MAKAKRVHSTPRKTAPRSKRANAPKTTRATDAEKSPLVWLAGESSLRMRADGRDRHGFAFLERGLCHFRDQ